MNDRNPNALDPLDQVVDCLGRSVRGAGPMERDDLVVPSGEGAAGTANLGRECVVLEISGQLCHISVGDGRVGDVIEEPDRLVGVPGVGDFALGVTSGE